MTVSGAPMVRQRWIHRDTPRGMVALAVSLVVSFGYPFLSTLLFDVVPDLVVNGFVTWDAFAVVYTVLTVVAFRGAGPDELAVLTRRKRQSGTVRRMLSAGDGPSTAVTLAFVALAGAALLPRLELFTGESNETALGIALVITVVTAWIIVVLSYAVFYARRNIEEPGLDFPGNRPTHGWIDYVYFSVSVATTLGTTDVLVTTARMRRTVLAHCVLTFIFNTVIIALLIAALTG